MTKQFAAYLTPFMVVTLGLLPVRAAQTSAVPPMQTELVEVAQSPQYYWNGIAITSSGRMFASFPRLYTPETPSVMEILKDGSLRPFPGGDWNTWSPSKSSDKPGERFVNVNAVYTDKNDNLWVVDAGTVSGKATPNGPKLVKINTRTGKVERVYRFPDTVLPEGSSLNDVRIGARTAFLTESGKGAIIVVDLESGTSRRLLDKHPSTKADPDIIPVIEGKKVLDEKGNVPRMNANNLELTPDEQFLLYKTSFGYRWYRIPTSTLLNPNLTDEQVNQQVQSAFEAMPTGGTTMDVQGNIYLMDLERRTIWRLSPSGVMRFVIHDERLLWHDASDIGPDGYLYIPVAQNHRLPTFNQGKDETKKPFQLFKLKLTRQTLN